MSKPHGYRGNRHYLFSSPLFPSHLPDRCLQPHLCVVLPCYGTTGDNCGPSL